MGHHNTLIIKKKEVRLSYVLFSMKYQSKKNYNYDNFHMIPSSLEICNIQRKVSVCNIFSCQTGLLIIKLLSQNIFPEQSYEKYSR